jgi:nitrilase
MAPSTKVRVGAVQAEPVWLDLEGSVDKTISLIKDAAKDGVKVLGFPEVWIPGYPWYEFNFYFPCSIATDS